MFTYGPDNLPLAGDMAYQLFVPNDERPLEQFLDDWKAGKYSCAAGYMIAVVNCYRRMQMRGHRYKT